MVSGVYFGGELCRGVLLYRWGGGGGRRCGGEGGYPDGKLGIEIRLERVIISD